MSEAFSEQDRTFMRRAIELARTARHECRPNPMVGAVIVRDGWILGEGFHRRAGEPHAEIEALRACSQDPRGATIYVTLEPCCHFGRTPPCTRALLEAGIGRVVAATLDPNPKVAGQGMEELRRAGVDARAGLLARPARRLNDAFAWQMATGRPFVTLKLAMTLDGRIADGSGRSQWITAERARQSVQRLRSRMDAILVGRGTADADDPSLTVRLEGYSGKQPLRVVLGQPRRQDLQLFREAPERTHVFPTRPDLGPVLDRLAGLGVQRLLVEGGGKVAGAFLDQGFVNHVYLYYAPKLLGSGRPGVDAASRPLAQALELKETRIRRLGPDLLVRGYLNDPLGLWPSC